MENLEKLIPIDRVTGLRPRTWLSVGSGFSREDFKALLLAGGRGLIAEAVTSPVELARRILTAADVLEGVSRQEVLRILLAEPRISVHFKELKRLRRQGNFFRRLDFAIQGGRMAAAHPEEEAVYSERLELRFGPNPLRLELRILAQAYEIWLEDNGLCDPPMLLRKAAESLHAKGWPETCARPEEILHFSASASESLESVFWEAVRKFVPVRMISREITREKMDLRWNWERWHTLDDACERLAEVLSREPDLRDHAILMAESTSVRRSVARALEQWGVPQLETRDPLRLQRDEALKWALLPLSVVAGNFERNEVISFLQSHLSRGFGCESGPIIQEIQARGIRSGLPAYSGGFLTPLHAELARLSGVFRGKKTCIEMAVIHLELLRAGVLPSETEKHWLLPFFESVWNAFIEDYRILRLEERRGPLLYWFERLQERIAQFPPPVSKSKVRQGIAVYRLQQAPLITARKLWIIGLGAQWSSGENVGDYWFSEREREVLSSEFAVRSGIQARSERLAAFGGWLRKAEQVTLLDAEYDSDGRERASLLPLLRELGPVAESAPSEPIEKGSHPRWQKSFGALRPLPPQLVQLPALLAAEGKSKPEITATALDAQSKCGFLGLAYNRWKANDLREPEFELWQDVKGNLLHESVRLLLLMRKERGEFGAQARELSIQAFDQAWRTKPPKGLHCSDRVRAAVRERLLRILVTFCEKEDQYLARSGAVPISLDDRKFSHDFGEFTIVGKPDRIDEISDGLFVIDYKTSGQLPSGTEMLEKSYRLQLPFYAVAVEKELGKPVLGTQFCSLTADGGRNKGVFFTPYNGKGPGKLTNAQARFGSVFDQDPKSAWADFETRIHAEGLTFVQGKHAARPKKATECLRCRVSDLCGYRRKTVESEEEVADGD